ncbi:MAG: hypothetical protein ACU85V_15460, partial [Gammaproteobacteria bacterium]
LFVVNKADQPDADKTVGYLDNVFRRTPEGDWRPPVLKAQALHHQGIEEIWQAIDAHREFRLAAGPTERARRLVNCEVELRAFLKEGLENALDLYLDSDVGIAALVQGIADGGIDIYVATDEILSRLDLATE